MWAYYEMFPDEILIVQDIGKTWIKCVTLDGLTITLRSKGRKNIREVESLVILS